MDTLNDHTQIAFARTRRIVYRLLRRLYRRVFPKPPLIHLRVLGSHGREWDLRFHGSSSVGLVKQSVGLQLSMDTSRIELTKEHVNLDDSKTLEEQDIKDGDSLKVQPVRQQKSAFIWNGTVCNPFELDFLSDHAVEKARWFHKQNIKDVSFRKRRIELFLKRSDLSGNQLVAMAFNQGFSSLFVNWAVSVRRYRIPIHNQCLVFPMDKKSDDIARGLGFSTCFDPDSKVLESTGTSRAFGDRQFARHICFQTAVIRDLLDFRMNLLFQDVDLVWLDNPLPLLNHDTPDVEFMYDGATRRHAPLCANTGFMYFRDKPSTRHFWDIVFSQIKQMFQRRGQQIVVNKILGAVSSAGLNVGILDEKYFVNGHRIGIDHTSSRIPEKPCVIHFSWTGDLKQKYQKYKNNGYWYLDREPEGGSV